MIVIRYVCAAITCQDISAQVKALQNVSISGDYTAFTYSSTFTVTCTATGALVRAQYSTVEYTSLHSSPPVQ